MEILTLNRRIFTDKSTIGDLYLWGEWFCNILEDTCRNIKIKGETCIPAGRYEVVLDESPRFQRIMPRLLNVPNYEGILIHWGNEAKDTEGCLLTGFFDAAKPDWISSSHKTFDNLFYRLQEVPRPIWITITGGPKI